MMRFFHPITARAFQQPERAAGMFRNRLARALLLGLLVMGVVAGPMWAVCSAAMPWIGAELLFGPFAAAAQFGHSANGADDQRFLDGLRSRALFELAETFCSQRLAGGELAPAEQAWLTVEMSRTWAQHAANSPPEQRAERWNRAEDVVRRFLEDNPEHPFALLLRLQAVRVRVDRAELLREEAEVLPASQARGEQAIALLQQAQADLERLAGETESQLREAGTPIPGGAERRLSAAQLTELLREIEFQLARATRNLGQCYPAGSDDRAAALSQAAAVLDRLAGLPTDHRLTWPARLDQARCLRLLGDYETAAGKLQAILQENPPVGVRLQARAEQIELALDRRQLSQAIALAGKGRQIERAGSPLLDLALLRLCLAAWQENSKAGNRDQAKQWQEKATQMVAIVRQEHSPYWVRRAQMLLAAYLQGESTGQVDLLVQAAENAYHSQQFDQALATYDRAAQMAAQAGQADRAFQLAFTAATIEHRRNRHRQALERYRRLGLEMPRHPQAPEAHLLALHHAAQLAKDDPSANLPLYEQLAEEHLRTWPQATTSDEVRWCLARLREAQERFPEAVELYRAIDPGFGKYDRVIRAAYRAWLALLERSDLSQQATRELISRGAEWFGSLVEGPGGRLPERWSPVQLWAAVAAARLELSLPGARLAHIEQVLRAALSQAGSSENAWRKAALAAMVECLGRGARTAEAVAFARELAAIDPGEVIRLIDRLGKSAGKQGGPQTTLPTLEKDLLGVLAEQRHRLTSEQQQQLDRQYASVLAENDPAQSLPVLRSLALQYPNDTAIQQAYARCLLQSGSGGGNIEEATAAWRRLEKLARPGSDPWFQAKVALAALHLQRGEKEQAERIVRFLRLMYPDQSLAARPAVAALLGGMPGEVRQELVHLMTPGAGTTSPAPNH